ncbi:hypothetical protein LCGC14_2096700 [marine sediment metagenome]|uniref:Uncharacterized protein n=1 Tax=marine sediment metagenome TaxID=412755 RepID=A0A0F9EBD8_9ZZZZ
MNVTDRYGRSAQQFLVDLFEFEYCEECGGDVEAHTAVPFLGNFFARCNENGPHLIEDFQALQEGRA